MTSDSSAAEDSKSSITSGYSIFDRGNGAWVAHGNPPWRSGSLFFDHISGKFIASSPEIDVLFPKLAKRKYAPEESPLDGEKEPKVEFLLLFALRQFAGEEIPGSWLTPEYWRDLAFGRELFELETLMEAELPPEKKKDFEDAVTIFEAFEYHVLRKLFSKVGRRGAADDLRRYAKWLDIIDEIQQEGIPANYQQFLHAVESAASEAKGVPTKKAVREKFNAGLTANQLGEETTFRSLMKRLHFTWLPNDSRGPAKQGKKSGRRSPRV